MQNTFFIKIYFLFLFVFLFTFSMWRFFVVDYLNLISVIFWVLILPLKHIFSNYFLNLNFFKKISIYTLFIPFCYLFSFSELSFLLLLFYSFFIVFDIDYIKFTIFWIFSYLIFIFLYIFSFWWELYTYFYVFSFYSFLLSITFYFFDLYNIRHKIFWKEYIFYYFLILFFIIFILSLYFNWLLSIVFYLLFLLLYFLSDLTKVKIIVFSSIQENIINFSLFFIIFIPLINDFLKIEQKNITFLFTFLSFSLTFIWFNYILKLIKK